MSITGQAFLKSHEAKRFIIEADALDQVFEYLGFGLTHGLARVLFHHSRLLNRKTVSVSEDCPSTTSPAGRRWRFAFRVFGASFEAIVRPGATPGEWVWCETRPVSRHEPIRLRAPERTAAVA